MPEIKIKYDSKITLTIVAKAILASMKRITKNNKFKVLGEEVTVDLSSENGKLTYEVKLK